MINELYLKDNALSAPAEPLPPAKEEEVSARMRDLLSSICPLFSNKGGKVHLTRWLPGAEDDDDDHGGLRAAPFSETLAHETSTHQTLPAPPQGTHRRGLAMLDARTKPLTPVMSTTECDDAFDTELFGSSLKGHRPMDLDGFVTRVPKNPPSLLRRPEHSVVDHPL